MRDRTALLASVVVVFFNGAAHAGTLTPIAPADVLANWTSEPAPQWNQAPEANDWVLVPGGVAQLMNGADTRVSDFGFSGDFTFAGIFRAIPELDADQDDDNMGVVFGWQDESKYCSVKKAEPDEFKAKAP
jgi:hypothetical protein